MKKIVVFGGGTGLSCLLSGLKQFPLDVTTIITVSDNGSSTGVLKKELDIPAVGDIGKVLLAMSNADSDMVELLGYRFQKEGTLHNHPIRNIILAALIDLKGSLTEATRFMCKLLQVKGTVLPLTEEKVELVGESEDGAYFGQVSVSNNIRNIRKLSYDHNIRIVEEIREKILAADLIIFSPGSLYTSIIPHLITEEIIEVLQDSKAPIMYVCNLVTQPGETDGYSVSDHIRVLNQYLRGRDVDVVITNTAPIGEGIKRKYLDLENKEIVTLSGEENARVIGGDIFAIEDEKIRHDALKTAFLIFSYLMEA